MGGGKSTQTTTVTRTPEETEYTRQQIELAKQQLAILEEQHGWQSEIFALTRPLLEQYSLLVQQEFEDANDPLVRDMRTRQRQLESEQLDAAIRNLPLQQELLDRQLEEIRRGGRASDEQKALISDITNRAIEAGDYDIARFLDTGLDKIRNEMAPARGMRPDDAPMIDAAQRVLEESLRQKGQLTSNLRGAQAQAELNFPLNAGQITNQWNQWQQGFNQSQNQFMNNLNLQARQNRAALMGQLFSSPMAAGEMGLNLIGAARPNPVDFPRTTTTTTRQSSNVLGGIGGLLSGIGSVGSLFSSKTMKENVTPLRAPAGHLLSPGSLKENIRPLQGKTAEIPQINPGPTPFLSKPTPDVPQINPGVNGLMSKGGFDTPQINPGPTGNLSGATPNLGSFGPIQQLGPYNNSMAPPRTEDEALDRIGRTPVSTWNYLPETGLPQTTHVGPMAEDFNSIVMGKAPEPFINTVDAIGSLMAGVKALDKRTKGLRLGKRGTRNQRRVSY